MIAASIEHRKTYKNQISKTGSSRFLREMIATVEVEDITCLWMLCSIEFIKWVEKKRKNARLRFSAKRYAIQSSQWVWSGNITITNCRQTHETARKSQTSITRQQPDKLSKDNKTGAQLLDSINHMTRKLLWKRILGVKTFCHFVSR